MHLKLLIIAVDQVSIWVWQRLLFVFVFQICVLCIDQWFIFAWSVANWQKNEFVWLIKWHSHEFSYHSYFFIYVLCFFKCRLLVLFICYVFHVQFRCIERFLSHYNFFLLPRYLLSYRAIIIWELFESFWCFFFEGAIWLPRA